MRKTTVMVLVAGLSIPLFAQACVGIPADATCEDRRVEGCDGTPNAEAGVDAGGGHDAADGKSEAATPNDGSSDEDAPSVDAKVDAPDAPGCDKSKSPREDPCVISDGLAVFVASFGDDTNPGTKAKPVKSWTRAVALASTATTTRIIACAGTYDSPLILSGGSADLGLSVFGGVACAEETDGGATWTYTGAKAIIAPASRVPALQLSALAKPITFEDFEFDALDADPTAFGSSSVAASISSVKSIKFTKTTFKAGSGAPGADGSSSTNPFVPNPSAQTQGGNAGVLATAKGGLTNTCTCSDGTSSTGGAGGSGLPNVSVSGAGLPSYGGAAPQDGAGGSDDTLCPGGSGNPGTDGPQVAADGAGATTHGSFVGTVWTPSAGTKGGNGKPGQGGGGGGDGKGLAGAGGGGGCGGCGGGGGTPGFGGGSSFGVLLISSGALFTGCEFQAGAGGAGGKGGDGSKGESGGASGTGAGSTPATSGCGGGYGGSGSGGNGAGGGAGGLSLGIAYEASAPTINGAVVSDAPSLASFTLGAAGGGGLAGAAGPQSQGGVGLPGAPGAAGLAGKAAAIAALP